MMWSVFLGAGVCVSGECVCVCAQVEDEESSQTKGVEIFVFQTQD